MTVEEMKEFLRRINIDVVNVRGVEIQALCPAHEERTGRQDRNPSWWINAETGQHICFSCQFKGGLTTLINQFTDGDLTNYQEFVMSPTNMLSRLTKLNSTTVEEKPDIVITESMLNAFVEPPTQALIARGLTIKSAAYHEVLWDDKKDNWIIPIRDIYSDALLGWQEKGTINRTFRNYPPKMKKSRSLFGYRKYSSGDMVVVESPLDVVRLKALGFEGGVATYGTQVSVDQFNAIRAADRLIIAMDNDEAGKNATRTLYELCKEQGKEAWFFDYQSTDMKDVGSMSKVEIESGLENARHITRGLR